MKTAGLLFLRNLIYFWVENSQPDTSRWPSSTGALGGRRRNSILAACCSFKSPKSNVIELRRSMVRILIWIHVMPCESLRISESFFGFFDHYLVFREFKCLPLWSIKSSCAKMRLGLSKRQTIMLGYDVKSAVYIRQYLRHHPISKIFNHSIFSRDFRRALFDMSIHLESDHRGLLYYNTKTTWLLLPVLSSKYSGLEIWRLVHILRLA